MIGEEFTYNLLVNDSNGDDITVTSSLNTSAEVSGPNGEGEVTITFILQEINLPVNVTAFSFTVTAKVLHNLTNQRTSITYFVAAC